MPSDSHTLRLALRQAVDALVLGLHNGRTFCLVCTVYLDPQDGGHAPSCPVPGWEALLGPPDPN